MRALAALVAVLGLGLGGCAFQTEAPPAPAVLVRPPGSPADFTVCATPAGCYVGGTLYPFLWLIPYVNPSQPPPPSECESIYGCAPEVTP